MKTFFGPLLLICLSAAVTMAQSGPANRFQQLDKNGDGKISREELGDDTRFKQYDRNGDGFVTLEEARAVYRAGKGKAASSTPVTRVAEKKTVAVEVKKALNVRYAEVPGADANLLSLDIYAPSNAAQCPVMVYVHGGGWARGDKQAVGIKPDYFCSRGWVFVSINYRLVPKVDIVAQAQDAANAVAWVHAQIAAHGGNPEKLHLMGHSAGAHLVALLGTNERFLKAAGKDLNILRSVVELDTQALDVPRMMRGSETAVYSQAFGKDEKIWREVSPLQHVAQGKDIPAFFLVVANNMQQKLQQATAFQKALREAGARCDFIKAPEHTHGSLNQDIGVAGDKVTAAMEKFLTAFEPLLQSSSGNPPAADTKPAVTAHAGSIPSGKVLFELVKAYAALGEHRTASAVDHATAEWLAGQLREAGPRVEFQEFTVPQFQLREARLKVQGKAVEAFPYWPTKATTIPISAPLALADAPSLQGRVVLVESGRSSRREEAELFRRLASAGAAGAVEVVKSPEGCLHVSNVMRQEETPSLPVLLVGSRHSDMLRRAAERGESAELLIAGEFQPQAKARNVIATLDRGPKRIFVSTPYSGWFRCAGERGSGLAVFLALARWAAERDTKFSYTFLANSGHELGYAGMRGFLDTRAPKAEDVACWLHLGANVALLPEARSPGGERVTQLFTTNPAWETSLASAFQNVPWVRITSQRQPAGELVFILPRGYPALNLAGGGNRFMHSPSDGLETTGPAVLEPTAAALVKTLEAIETRK